MVEEASLEQIIRTLILHFVALTSGYSPDGNNFEYALAMAYATYPVGIESLSPATVLILQLFFIIYGLGSL